ncbi:hypothetical protein FVE85_1163 [Porphyridium purpureum]|uniref:Nudix hydrolase domain-containing protein n=1 Tax=Porphyridium purpureum TaxID=35688 RepID=A0A5J4Z3F7_PORPP|nr:hypothetical protein FVE85_1163 [Porphyridium purpureum]|eukprot:POR7027..scf208_2
MATRASAGAGVGGGGNCRALFDALMRATPRSSEATGGHMSPTRKTSRASVALILRPAHGACWSDAKDKPSSSSSSSSRSETMQPASNPNPIQNAIPNPSLVVSGPGSLRQLERARLQDLEVLFIQRAARSDDPWSGHLALPGGKRDGGETDLDTAIRETLEEVGLDLRANWQCCGRLNDRRVPKRTGRSNKLPPASDNLAYCTFVFLQVRAEPVQLHLNEAEIQSAFWVPLDIFSKTELVDRHGVIHTGIHFFPWLRKLLPRFLFAYLKLDEVAFPAVNVWEYAVDVAYPARGSAGSGAHNRPPASPPPPLWGLTLSAISDFISLDGRYTRLDVPLMEPRNRVVRFFYTWFVERSRTKTKSIPSSITDASDTIT